MNQALKKTIVGLKDPRSFNFTHRYADDVLCVNNPKCGQRLQFTYHPRKENIDISDTLLTASF